MSSALISFTSGIADYLLYGSIIAALLVIIAWTFIKLGKIKAPVYHHLIWFCTLFAALILPFIWLYAPKVAVPVLPAQTIPEITMTQQVDIEPSATPAKPGSLEIEPTAQATSPSPVVAHHNPLRSIPIKTIVVCLWSVGFLLMLIRLIISWQKIKTIVSSAEPFFDDMLSALSRLVEQSKQPSPRRKPGSRAFFKIWIPAFAGMTKCGRIKLLISPEIESPLCFGILRPVILLPKKMYAEGMSEDLNMVLHHELAHIERKDCCVNLFQRLIEAVFFFHPFMWYASSQLTQNREILCDHHVLAKGASPFDYVQMLTRIIEQGFEKNNLHAVALFEGRLLTRVKSLLQSGNKIQLKVSRWAMLTGIMVILLFLASGAIHLEAKSTDNDQDSALFTRQEETFANSNIRPTGDCSISGKVVSAETGDPVGDVQVALYNTTGADVPIYIRVASDGTFEFKDIPDGTYRLGTLGTEDLLSAIYNAENNGNQTFSMKAGEIRSGIILQVKPVYSISGKVFDKDGQPLRDSQLKVLAYVERDEHYSYPFRYSAMSSSPIADDGSYHLDRLDGSPVNVVVIDPNSDDKDHSLHPCYYPGSTSREEAEMVYFDEDKNPEGIDIRLIENRDFILEGIVTDSDTGMPVPKTLITVHPIDMIFANVMAYTDERGYYRIDNMSTGEFYIHVDAETWGYVRTQKIVEIDSGGNTGQQDFTLTPAASISGRFIDEAGNPVEIITSDSYGLGFGRSYTITDKTYPSNHGYSWTATTNKYAVEDQNELQTNTFNDISGDYSTENMVFPSSDTFLIQGILPGKTRLSFSLYSRNKESRMVKRILYKDQDIIGSFIETKPGEKIEEVTIVIASGTKYEIEQHDKAVENLSSRMQLLYNLDFIYAPLFQDLNLSTDKLAEFKELLVDYQMACGNAGDEYDDKASDGEKASLNKRYAGIHEEYNARFRQLLGETDYQKYYEYYDRSYSRYRVNSFMASLSPDERLSSDQQQELIEIIHDEQMKAYSELSYDPRKTFIFSDDQQEELEEKATEKIYLNSVENAKEIMSASQHEQFESFIKNRLEEKWIPAR